MKNIPHHVAIIMDGNRRFANKNHLHAVEGHKKGAEKIEEVCIYAKNMGIKILTLFAFSSENWNRDEEELMHLNSLLKSFLHNKSEQFIKNNTKVSVIGNIAAYDSEIQKSILNLEKKTEQITDGLHLVIALNYGGKADIVQAVNTIKNKSIITEQDITDNLYTKNIPAPDLLIRTGGAQRLSNFLLWQMAYTELYFTSVLWPEFTNKDLEFGIDFFKAQQRNFGK